VVQTTLHELLDIVDVHDRVTGVASRGEIHARGLMHRSVHVLVFNSENSVLLQKRSMQKDQFAGMWDSSCAGHVESGQSYEETAPRELQEELGFSPVEPLKAEDEIDELRWFTRVQIDEWIKNMEAGNSQDLTSGFIEIWCRFREESV